MKRKDIASEIVCFCVKHKKIKASGDKREIKKAIEQQLVECAFIENVINTIFIKAKEQKILREKRTMDLLIELEMIRLRLEDNESNKS